MKFLIDVPIEPSALAALQATGRHTFTVIDPPGEAVRPLDPALIRDADGLFCSLPPKNFAEMTAVRWVQLASTGYSQLFGLDLPARGIRATNCRGCFDVPIAEWCVAMMVNLARDARQMIRNQEAAIWDRSAQFQREIRGLTVGLWGYGGIGRETARLARALGMEVWVVSRGGIQPRGEVYSVPGTGDPEGELPDRVFVKGQEREFLSGLDFLILAMPLTPATEGIVGEAELRALRPTAYLLNPARGPLVQQEPLLRALRENWIAGAAIDTHYQYPLPPEHPLWAMENVILTPHISGSSLSPHFISRVWEIFSENVGRFHAGKALLNQLTAGQLSGV